MNSLLRSVIDQLNDAYKKFEREKRDNLPKPVPEIRVLYIDAEFYQAERSGPLVLSTSFRHLTHSPTT
ncbi:MAG: hypothetical protein U0936_20490 [Planctomycetaceae bacterium]